MAGRATGAIVERGFGALNSSISLSVILVFVLASLALLSLGVGHFPVAISTIARVLLSRIVTIEPDWSPAVELVVFNVRGPRIIAAMFVGAALSVAGTAYQCLFRNPLAASDILGVSAGAGFGASLAITFGLSQAGVQGLAFVLGLLAVGICFALGQFLNRHSTVMLALAGIVVAAFFQALISILKIFADPVDILPVITFWLLGGLNRISARDVPLSLALVTASVAALALIRWEVTVLSAGQDDARTMGVNTLRVRVILVLASTLMTAAAVSIAGIVGWIGLVVPHIARILIGASFHRALPVAALVGAILLLLMDDLCRTVGSVELPLGIVTAVLGAPLFIVLLARSRERHA